MSNPVKWGILSTAGIAQGRVIPAMQAAENCSVDAIASRQEGTARAVADKLGIERAYGSYEALLADPEIEAVYIPLPNHMHVEWCAKAMEAGKHVLCEKPIAMSAEEAASLVAVRDRTGKFIEEAFAIRNHPQWKAMRDIITSGEIGEIRFVQSTMCADNRNPNDIRNKADIGGGSMYDQGSYCITGARYVFGEEPKRAISLLDIDPTFKTDRLSSAILQFPSGQAVFTVSTQAGPSGGGSHQHFSVVGSTGWIRAEFPFAHGTPTACRLFIGHDKSVGTKPAREMEFPALNQYTLQGERFSRLIRGENVEQFPLESAINNMRVIDAIFRSGKSESWEKV